MDCCVNFGSQHYALDVDAIGAALSPQLRIQRIFLAPGCLKLDYKVVDSMRGRYKPFVVTS